MTAVRIDEQRLARVVERLAARPETSGGVLAVGGDDGVCHALPFGPVAVDDRFLLTSIAKPFTLVQVLQLVEQGLFDLDVPIAEYLPAFGVNGKERVTARHVLTHTSGMDAAANTVEGPPTSLTAGEHLEVALRCGLVTEPGERFAYCSPGFWVLAELVSRLSGIPYPEHLRTQVTEPLGLLATGYAPEQEPPEGLVPAEVEPSRAHVAEQVRRTAYPAGGLVGTASDLVVFGRSLLGDGPSVLRRRTVETMLRPARSGTLHGRAVTWGLGWEIGGPGSLQGPRTLFHPGASGVGMWLDVDADVVVVLLTATWALPLRVFAETLNGVMASSELGSA
jgi:serine-type D-Ala-D-Ala carboxypeptidase